MATYVEMVNPAKREITVLADGVVVERYIAEQCDKCAQWKRADKTGFTKWFNEPVIWLCVECRR